MGSESLDIPKIDFSGLVLENTDQWDHVQRQVMLALETFGCFEALLDNITPELREALFGRAIPEVLSLPVEVKRRNKASLLVSGYTEPSPDFGAYECMSFNDVDIDGFTSLMWPQGNPTFRDTISTYAKHMKDLEQTTTLMVCRGLGIEKSYESLSQGTTYYMKLSEYGNPSDKGIEVPLPAHLDANFVTILTQNQVDGLEVQTKEGEWIHILPTLNSSTVMLGEAFEAWSNGRLSAPPHRVRIIANEKRNSLLLASAPKAEYIIQAPKELVDEEHPLLYKAFKYEDHLKFRFSDILKSWNKTLKDFHGVTREEGRT